MRFRRPFLPLVIPRYIGNRTPFPGWTLLFGVVRAQAANIKRIPAELEAERAAEGYIRRKEAEARHRDKAQVDDVEDFFGGGNVAGLSCKLRQFRPKGGTGRDGSRNAGRKWHGRQDEAYTSRATG